MFRMIIKVLMKIQMGMQCLCIFNFGVFENLKFVFFNLEEVLMILVEKFVGIEEEFVKFKEEFMILWGYL